MILTFFFIVVFLAFAFGVINGFIDGGSLVSTVITTRAMEPFSAVILVALCEILGLFVFGQAVSQTLGSRLVHLPAMVPALETLSVVAAALLGALLWNTGMWRLALPSSSGHALVGGLLGAVLSKFGPGAVVWPVFIKIFILLGIVPMAAGLASVLLTRLTHWAGQFITPAAVGPLRALQIAALMGIALAHGSNDGQKSVAMIVLGGVALGAPVLQFSHLPWWLALFCGTALAVGVLVGSRRIFGTLGRGLYRIQPLQGFCAESSTMVLMGISSSLGYPMSTTQVISSSVLGAGLATHPRGVRWTLARDMGVAWLVTIPAAGLLAAAVTVAFKEILHVVS